MADITICEVLCFIFNTYSVLAKTQLKSVLVGFYQNDELTEVKNLLFTDASKLAVDGKQSVMVVPKPLWMSC